MTFTFIYVAAPNEQEARKISKHLLEQKLVACANFFPIKSMYRWEGKIQDEQEFVIILKTVEENHTKVKQEIEKIHSYSTPCITQIEVKPNEKYGEWLNESLE